MFQPLLSVFRVRQRLFKTHVAQKMTHHCGFRNVLFCFRLFSPLPFRHLVGGLFSGRGRALINMNINEQQHQQRQGDIEAQQRCVEAGYVWAGQRVSVIARGST